MIDETDRFERRKKLGSEGRVFGCTPAMISIPKKARRIHE